MKYGNDLFAGRYWSSVFAVGAVLLLALASFWGYRLWENTQKDAQNAQKVVELQTLSSNVLFFSESVVTGNASAVKGLNASSAAMDGAMEFLLQADSFTKRSLSKEYEAAINFWRSIRNNSTAISETEDAVVLMNNTVLKLEKMATDGQKNIAKSIAVLAQNGTPSAIQQINLFNTQAALLQSMANNLRKFSGEVKVTSKSFDDFRINLVNYEKNHQVLIAGNPATNLAPLTDQAVLSSTQNIYQQVQAIKASQQSILKAVEGLLFARDAQGKTASSFEGLQFVLGDMKTGVENLGVSRFPQPIYIIIVLVFFVVFVIGFIFALKSVSRATVEQEQTENESLQAAILRLLDELADLADGDLTVSTTVSEDFTGAIADSVNYTIDQLRQLVSRINKTAVQVSGAAQESQQTALHLAEASDHQAQEIAGASAAINEMAVTIDQVSANAAESALVASKSVSIANNGAKLVQNTIHGMDTIREQIQDTSKRIKRLGESSQEIGDIVSLINDIADQTNILALNAAIQASMAGDAGRGFAVVADEVQRLAERSAGATKQIESLVKTIQSDTNEAVTSMEQTTSEVVSGARLAQDAGVALEEVEGVSANIAELIQNISNAARQQASSAGHISNTMNVIQEITSQTSAGTGATAQSIGDLADMAFELRESVAGFKLPEEADFTDSDLPEKPNDWAGSAELSEPKDANDDINDLDISEDAIRNAENDLAHLFESEEEFTPEEAPVETQPSHDMEAEPTSSDDAHIHDTIGESDLDFSEEMLELVDTDGVDLTDEDFDLSDFDFTEDIEDVEEADPAR